MPDYGHDLLFGATLVPDADDPAAVLRLAEVADRAGLDLVSVPDHPYRPELLDAWTVLSVIAARTSRVRVFPNVANVPLRPPAVLARSVASLDLLSAGRAGLALGAGAYWQAIASQGGPWHTAGEAVDALAEAIEVVRALWTPGSAVRVEGEHHRLAGTPPGPFPRHDMEVWVGALGPRMLRLTGRSADGWLPSMPRVGPDRLASANAIIDEAAAGAERSPEEIRRLYNLAGVPYGDTEAWAEQLAGLALIHGMSAFLLPADSPGVLRVFAEEVAPRVRELVAAERRGDPMPEFTAEETAEKHAAGARLTEVHDHLRAELAQLRLLMREVLDGTLAASTARSRLHEMTVRQNNWTLGSYCESYCRLVTAHHLREDVDMFPQLRRFEPSLGPVLDRLEAEHHAIAELVEGVDRALVAFVGGPDGAGELRKAVELLSQSLEAHLSYEEQELNEPLARLGTGLRFTF